MAEVERKTRGAITQMTAELAERRKAATAAVTAEYNLIKQREFALLGRIGAMEKEKIQRGLDELDT